MDGSTNLNIGVRGRKRVVPTSRRVWTYVEELELLGALKDLVVKGQKCDNGFKSGYLLLLENVLILKFPGTDLKVRMSKVNVGVSGIGLNSSTYHIDALPDVWDAYVKVDPTARGLKNKTFPFYQDWLDIFGNDHANGNDSQFYSDAVNEVNKHAAKKLNSSQGFEKLNSSQGFEQAGETLLHTEFTSPEFASFNQGESSSATKDKKKVLKRTQIDGLALQFIDTMGTISDKNDSRFGQIAESMGSIAQRIGSEFETGKKRGEVYDTLGLIESVTVESRVEVAEYLCNNSKDMDLFYSLPDDAKTVYVKRIMRKLGCGI
ncbi:hypothetical protein ACS0TY_028589 [Phlomoides rotata]